MFAADSGKQAIFSEDFESSNKLCPITGYVLTAGTDDFGFTSTADDFTVTLKPTQSTTVGVYSFTVTATAEGEGTKTVTQKVEVTPGLKICYSNELDTVAKSKTLLLPLSGVENQAVFRTAENYIKTSA